MAMIYSIRELAKGGKGIGRYRYIGQSDEQSHVIDELCDCDNGHPTHAEAEQCPKAKARLDKLFHRDIDSLRAQVDQKRRELRRQKARFLALRLAGASMTARWALPSLGTIRILAKPAYPQIEP